MAARAGIIYFEQGGIADPITARGYKTLLRTCPKAQYFSRSQLRFTKDWIAPQINKKPSEVRLALVHEDSAYGSSISKNVEAEAKAAGIPLVSTIPYNAQAVDLSSVILKLKNDKPDVVIGVSYANDAILLGRQAKELGLDIKAFIGTGGGHSLTEFPGGPGFCSRRGPERRFHPVRGQHQIHSRPERVCGDVPEDCLMRPRGPATPLPTLRERMCSSTFWIRPAETWRPENSVRQQLPLN